jgi:16S rRNA processing protein RimM
MSTGAAEPPGSAAGTEVVVGRIGKPHGLRGEVTIEVRTDEPELRFTPGAVLRAQSARPTQQSQQSQHHESTLTVSTTRWHQGVLLVRFEELADRTGAEAWRGTLLLTDLPPDASPADPEEFYAHQLVGLAVHDLEGRHLGQVSALVPGAQDLLSVRTTDGRDALVPFVSALVPEVDVPGGRIAVADRPGLVSPFPEDEPQDTDA